MTWDCFVGTLSPQMNLIIILLHVCFFSQLTLVMNILRVQKPFLFALRRHRENLAQEAPRIIMEYFDTRVLELYCVVLEQHNSDTATRPSLQYFQALNKKFDAKVKEFGLESATCV